MKIFWELALIFSCFMQKKSHDVASLSGNIDLRGFLIQLFILFPPTYCGKIDNKSGFALKFNDNRLQPQLKTIIYYWILSGKSRCFSVL